MAGQTKEERIKKIDDKMAQLKTQKQALLAREKEKARKERTRRLIQIGALAEKYLDCEGIEPAEFEKLICQIAPKKLAGLQPANK